MCAVDVNDKAVSASIVCEPRPEKSLQPLLRSLSPSPKAAMWKSVLSGSLVAAGVAIFSTFFPSWIDPTPGRIASTTVYKHALYQYDSELSLFDNSFLTFGTDYGLALAMILSAWCIMTGSKRRQSVHEELLRGGSSKIDQQLLQAHIWRSRGMLLTYMLSVLAGGVAHQFFTTLESRNTLPFRLLWTICVGSVTAASGFMGSIGSSWAAYDKYQSCPSHLPVIPVSFWVAYAVVCTLVVVVGGWSFQRPACDIFVAGITQFPSTFYMMGLLWWGLPTVGGLSWSRRLVGVVVFILNAPLLPLYPLLVYYCTPQLSMGQVNAILHSNLLLAWFGQGRVLRKVALAWEACLPPPRAVPVKKTKVF